MNRGLACHPLRPTAQILRFPRACYLVGAWLQQGCQAPVSRTWFAWEKGNSTSLINTITRHFPECSGVLPWVLVWDHLLGNVLFAKPRGVNFDKAQIELMVMNHDVEPYISMRRWTEKWISRSESTLSTLWLCNFMQIIYSRSLLGSCGENVMRKIGDMAQWSKAHTALVGDRSLVPSACIG